MARIFIVDDEPIIGVGLKTLIGEYKRFSEIETFTNSVSALSSIRANPPDVVMTDIRMPRMDGLELCRNIQQLKLLTKVVVLSGYGDFVYAQKCMSYGVQEYLLKPITEIELYPVLDKLLATRDAALVSFSLFEQWVDQLEEAVWMLDKIRVSELLEEGKRELFAGESDVQQYQRVYDAVSLLLKKLNARGTYRIEAKPLFEENTVITITYEWFQAEIGIWMQRLSEYRKYERINVLEAAIQYIDEHLFEEELSLDRVAGKLGITPTYFSHYFKKNTNETFVQYRMRKRIDKAKQLLAVPHYRITDIGAEVGYESYPHFSRVFKKATGYSPTEYRALLGIK
ncbi:response regulator [Paenibacillus sp. CGMCC 1.16610]|uniref:Response regulator n=1 Tax=Paenibacillus anseongense TaxID=2682845 RepID=A0ABW9UCS6_9BACL|nr:MULTISPECIES: response regulator [Paenibacillus]MBA2944080.1 response regulator [Paenibacillus sp. CGMCC 1.16610]MVQ37969.1 response regulator [Paenibacillus anseongense]